MNLDIGKAFTYITEDPKWVTKILIGGGLILAGIVTLVGWLFTLPVVGGYMVMTARNVINGNPQPLPEWEDFGNKWIEGIKAWVVGLVYSLPFGLIIFLVTIPGSILSSSNNDGAVAAGVGLSLLANCVSFLGSFIIALIQPAAIGRYAATSDIGSALQVGTVFAMIRQNIGTYIVIALITTFLVPLLAGIGIIACFIGAAFTGFYAYLMVYHLYGQAYRTSQGASVGYGQQYGQPRPF